MSKIFQLKIKLLKSKPLIWRRVQLRDSCNFWDLHVIIRDTMVWTDSQPHYFKIIDNKKKEIIIRSYLDDYDNNNFPLSWNIKIKKYITNNKYTVNYVYGTDENHVHLITHEKTLYKQLKYQYPRCISGTGSPEEESFFVKSPLAKKVEAAYKFNVDHISIQAANNALINHKLSLFDGLYC